MHDGNAPAREGTNESPPIRRRARLELLLVLTLALAHASIYLGPFEDSFITYRYAENLANGHGLVYNVGERVEGYTSFLFTILLALVARLGGPIVLASQLLSLVAGLACVVLAARLARALGREDAAPPVASSVEAMAGLLVAASGTFAYYATTGMETTLFAALVGAPILLLVRGRAPAHAFGAGLLLGVAALTRPEGFGYAGLVVGALLLVRADRRDAVRVLLSFALLAVPYFALRWQHFGHPLPNTYYAKASPSAELHRTGIAYAEAFLVAHGFLACVLAAAVRARRLARARGARLVLFTVLGAIANVVLVGADTFAFFRFFAPVIPIGAAVLAVELARAFPRRPRLGATVTLAIAALVYAAELRPTHSWLVHRAKSERERVADVRAMNERYLAIGAGLRRAFPQGTWIAINAAGIIPYVSGLPTIDMLGLTDAHIAHRDIELGHGAAGHEKHDAAYVLARRPTLILLGLPGVFAPGPLADERVAAIVMRYLPYLASDREMVDDPRFARWYDPAFVPVPGGATLVFRRRAMPRADGELPAWLPRRAR